MKHLYGWLLVIGMGWTCSYAAAPPVVAPTTKAAAKPLESLDEVVARLPRFTVAGKVEDPDGKPVEGADVFLYYSRGLQGVRDRVAGRTVSGSGGAFRFENAGVWEPELEASSREQRQRYYVIIRHAEHGLEFATILEGDGCENLTVTFGPPRQHTIYVEDPAEKPLAGSKVWLFYARHAKVIADRIDLEKGEKARDYQYLMLPLDVGICSGVTDAGEGKVSLPGPAADARFMAVCDGYARGAGSDPVAVLCPGARVSGRVSYPDGTPAAGVAVFFTYNGQRLMASDAAVTDEQGRYRFDHVPGSGYFWAGIDRESQKGQGTGSIQVRDLRPGSPLASE
jgi:hypothetical protein